MSLWKSIEKYYTNSKIHFFSLEVNLANFGKKIVTEMNSVGQQKKYVFKFKYGIVLINYFFYPKKSALWPFPYSLKLNPMPILFQLIKLG